VVWCGFLTNNNTIPTKVVLNCFGLLVGSWQLKGCTLFGWCMSSGGGGGEEIPKEILSVALLSPACINIFY
jgi:hypothetical protein